MLYNSPFRHVDTKENLQKVKAYNNVIVFGTEI